MSHTETITVKEVRDAYEQTELTPMKGQMYRDPTFEEETIGSACGIGVLRIAESPRAMRNESPIFQWAKRKYGQEYVEGFIDGFDKRTHNTSCLWWALEEESLTSTKRFRQGLAAGKRCAKAVLND